MRSRIEELDVAWKIYEEWLKYDATDKDGVYKTFEQWLHGEYKKQRLEKLGGGK